MKHITSYFDTKSPGIDTSFTDEWKSITNVVVNEVIYLRLNKYNLEALKW